MRRFALTWLLPVSMLLIGSAQASTIPVNIARIARASIVVPPEWDGIWTIVDTVYTCQGAFQGTGADADTLCGGKDYSAGSNNFVCSGTADATTIDATCTGSEPFLPDCVGDYSIVTHGTRTGTTYFMVSTINITYVGTGCPIPSACFQINTHGTYVGPAPTAFCATVTRPSTWGQIKALFR